MFKNKDGSYNKGSTIITLLIITIVVIISATYIIQNVELPKIESSQPQSDAIKDLYSSITLVSYVIATLIAVTLISIFTQPNRSRRD